jgi:DNA-binding response OmpR family regulator
MNEILIVDDERVIREGYAAMLEAEGYEVSCARDGVQALEKFAAHRPDLVILDVMMPKLNGFKTCEEIRKLDKTVPIVFLTCKSEETDQMRALSLGCDHFLAKDASDNLILSHVRRALERSRDCDNVEHILEIGAVKVNLTTSTIKTPSEEIRLSKSESDVLRVLASKRGEYIGKNEMINALRGKDFACSDSFVYTLIARVRKKLGDEGAAIETDRFLGYKLKK